MDKENIIEELKLQINEKNRQLLDYTMTFNMISEIAAISTEDEIINKIFNFIKIIFGVGIVRYIPFKDGNYSDVKSYPEGNEKFSNFDYVHENFKGDYKWIASGEGFIFKIKFKNEFMGLLEVDHIVLPNHKEQYLKLILLINEIIGIAISNARKYYRLREKEDQIKFASFHDDMTGLYNRNFFELELKRLEDPHCAPVGIIICDVDRLKFTNDNYGHKAGDELLKSIARALKECFEDREDPIRIGEDEFAVLFSNCPKSFIESKVKQLKKIIERTNKISKEMLTLNVSIGYAVSSNDNINIEELVKQADNAMYREKMQHRMGYIG